MQIELATSCHGCYRTRVGYIAAVGWRHFPREHVSIHVEDTDMPELDTLNRHVIVALCLRWFRSSFGGLYGNEDCENERVVESR